MSKCFAALITALTG